MKHAIIAPASLYTFLSYCNDSALDRVVLDCGAGGSEPPLALFHDHGYTTHGVDISERQLKKSRRFCAEHGVDLGIVKGDMRDLPFTVASMSFVYSYASICHMTKSDVGVAMKEINRVLKPGGSCFVSFCAVPDRWPGGAKPEGPGEYSGEEDGEAVVHSIFDDGEPDRYFATFTFLRQEKRQIRQFGEPRGHAWAEHLYFATKR